jgi:hypothetical protein
VPDVLVQVVVAAETRLDGDELSARVLLVGEEEQPGIEQPGRGVDAVGVGVAAAQDLLPTVGFRGREPDVRTDRDHRLAVLGDGGEVRCIEFRRPRQRSAAGLEAAEHVLLVGQVVRVPRLDHDWSVSSPTQT